MRRNIKKISIQKAAAYLISENKAPMTVKEIVEIAQSKDLVRKSKSLNPTNSFIQTLERNIRMNTGNHPQLKFVYDKYGVKYIDLFENINDDFKEEKKANSNNIKKSPIKKYNDKNYLNDEIMKNIKLYMIANEIVDENIAINQLLKFAIKENLNDTLSKINQMTKEI